MDPSYYAGDVLSALACGFVLESVAMSDTDSVESESACEGEQVNSPALINPKNLRQHAAPVKCPWALRPHSVHLPEEVGCDRQPLVAYIVRRMAFSMYESLGSDASDGSGKPALIW